MLPHQREEPDAALPDRKICWGKGHPRIKWRFWSIEIVLSVPTKSFAMPVDASFVKLLSKSSHFIQFLYHNRHHRRKLRRTHRHLDPNRCHVCSSPLLKPPGCRLETPAGCARSHVIRWHESDHRAPAESGSTRIWPP